MTGDSQMRYVASELMALMGAGDRARYTAMWGNSSKVRQRQVKEGGGALRAVRGGGSSKRVG